MNPIVKKILTVLAAVAALIYTVFNYANGKTTLIELCIACVILGYPLFNIIASLIEDLKNR